MRLISLPLIFDTSLTLLTPIHASILQSRGLASEPHATVINARDPNLAPRATATVFNSPTEPASSVALESSASNVGAEVASNIINILTASRSSTATTTSNLSPTSTSQLVMACSNGTLNIPSTDDWNNNNIDNWFTNWWGKIDWAKYDANGGSATVGYVLGKEYGRGDLSCNYDGLCTQNNKGECAEWLGTAPNGPDDAAKAFIWYAGYQVLADCIYLVIKNTDTREFTVSGEAADVTTTFVSAEAAAAPWDKYASIAGPALGAISGAFGGLGFGAVSGGLGFLGGTISALIAGISTENAPPQDSRIDSLGDLEGSLTTMFDDINAGLEAAYTTLIIQNNGSGSPGDTTLDIVLKGGAFVDSGEGGGPDPESAVNDGSLDQAIQQGAQRLFEYYAINTAWRQGNTFIAYIPYGVKIAKYNGFYDSFAQSDCQSILSGSRTWPYGNCNGQGMTVLVADPHTSVTSKSSAPKGVDSTSTIGGNPFAYTDVMASSVGGWLHTGFNANVTNPVFQGLTSGSISVSSLKDLENLNAIPPTAEGIFNIPVCQLYDLNSVYGYNGPSVYEQYHPEHQGDFPLFWCGCLENSANSPAPGQGGVYFKDQISSDLQAGIKTEDPTGCQAYTGG